jgi:hypothetical protein
MTFARRFCAATVALVLAVYPLAMERCRSACVTPVVQTAEAAPSAHACHEASPDGDSGARMDPMARACGHSDEARVDETVGLAAAKTRAAVLLPLVEPAPYFRAQVTSSRTLWSSLRLDVPRPPLPLNSPLRL